jgi:hypothetical protein
MDLCMQDDQISQKFIGLTPADMDRLPHLINTEKKFSVVNNLVRQLGLHLSRACLVYKGNRPFLFMHSPSSLEDYSDFYGQSSGFFIEGPLPNRAGDP